MISQPIKMVPVPARERDRLISMAAEEEIMLVLRKNLNDIAMKTPTDKQKVFRNYFILPKNINILSCFKDRAY